MANGSNTIGLCMIVKNEANLIRRCLASALPLVDYILVVDTGSTDGTEQIVCDFLDEHNVQGAVLDEPWRDFAYNRSFALQRLREVPGIDYALMLDADDVLVLDPGFDAKAFKAQMRHDHYDVLVDEGAVTHFRGHICSNRLPYAYKGVLHEYLDAPPGERGHTKATGISIHASRGGARSQNPRKYHDDAAVLEQALTTETDPGLVSRYTFYLAQSYRDAGRLDDAARAYAKRAEMGGWVEEAWHARLAEARCLRDLKDEGGFLRQALAAFSQRPQRAEPLYDLARYHRDRGQHEAAALFAEQGLAIGRPEGDTLFVEDSVYQYGLQEEYSIAANYARDPARKDRGFAACNWLALNRDVPAGARDLARHNLRFYVEPAAKLLPSFAARPVGFTPPEGWHPMNPSVTRRGDEIVMVQRTVNFVLEDGNYRTPDDGPVVTRNFLLRLDEALAVESSAEILPPTDLPAPSFGLVLGFEDMRLFAWHGALWCIATLCELTQEGWRQQVLARIDESGTGPHRLVDWRVLEPVGPRRHEKNWMPLVEADPDGGERLRFVYLCDPTRLVDDAARTVAGAIPPIAAEEFRGGSQAIEFAGGWLALVHEVGFSDADNKERLYHHRFVWFDDTYALRGVSRPFIFERPGIEFAAGLAWHPDGKRLIISYGVGDGTAWLATVDADDVRAALEDAARLPSGAPAAEKEQPPSPFPLPPSGGERVAKGRRGAAEPYPKLGEGDEWEPHAEGERDVTVEPETPAAHSPAAAVGAPAEQDVPQTDQPPAPELGSFGAENFESQHALRPARDLHALVDPYPRVLIAILAKQREKALPLFLRCIEGLDYPKSSIVLYVRTNNNTDRTEEILRDWIARTGPSYAGVEFDAAPVDEPVETFGHHEWNAIRFRVLGRIRNVSLQKTLEHGCDFYFVCDTDNFIRSCTLKELVALNLPIVAPFLRVMNPTHTYSNFFAAIDPGGFYAGCDEFQWITHRWVRGVFEVPVVHCTYLVRNDVIPQLHYLDGSDNWEFVVFCKSAREAGIPQYLDNRQVYGYLTFDPDTDAGKTFGGERRHGQIGFARAELERVDGPKLSAPQQPIGANAATSSLNNSPDQMKGLMKAVSAAPSQATDPKKIWSRNLSSESDFWEQWLSDDRFSAFRDPRIPSTRPLPADYTMHLDPSRAIYSILDVGSGPISTIGVHLPGKIVLLYPVDPLADDYGDMLEKYQIQDTVRPIKVEGEKLNSAFPKGYFDICSCTNALDHCYDPIAVIREMLAVCKPGGWLRLSHVINEGERESYHGLHQWNLDWRKERFIIWNRKIETDVLDAVPGTAAIETQIEEGNPRTMTLWMQKTIREEVDGPKLSAPQQPIEADEAVEEMKRRFSEIYNRRQWGPGSGVGSAPDKTGEYRAFLQQFMVRNHVRSVVDFGCGDWQFSRLIDWSGVRYLGVDVVPAVIEKNRRDFGGDNITFEIFESLAKLPRADLLLCKDLLQHLPNKTVKDYLAAFRKKYRFSLITDDEEPAGIQNTDIDIAGWRTLRLGREPFWEPGAVVLSWHVPYLSGGTTKSTYLLSGDSATSRAIGNRPTAASHSDTNTTADSAALKFLPAHFEELVRTFWVPKSAPQISARSPHDVSIVSAFFDIGRGDWSSDVNGVPIPEWQRRSTDTYLARFGNLAGLRNQMVIFTEERFAGAILDIRRQHGLEELTTIMVCDDLLGENGQLADLYRSIELTMGSELHGLVHNPGYPEFWNPDYVLLMALKPVFVCAALDLRLIANAQVAWVDFGYCRDDQRFDPAVPWHFDCRGRMNIFYVQAPDDRPIFDVIRSGAQYFQGCHLVGPAECWPRFRELMDEAWASLLACGLVHHDEPSISMAYRRMPQLFLTHAVDACDWFVLFRKFREVEAEVEAV